MAPKPLTLNKIINCNSSLLNLKSFKFDPDTIWDIGVNVHALSAPMNKWYFDRQAKIAELSPKKNNISAEKPEIQILFANWLKEAGEAVIEVSGIIPLKKSKLLANENQIPGLELSYLMCIIDAG